MKSTLPDKIVSYFNPEAGMRRYRARIAEAQLGQIAKRHFEGASSGRRTEGWMTPGSSANTAAALALPALRNRSRDLVRNNPYAERAIRILSSHAVGPGIVPKAGGPKGKAKKANDLWKQWAESTDCDLTGRSNFYGLQTLVMRGIAEGGEVLVRRVRSAEKGLNVPFQLQLLEADFLDHNRTWLRTKVDENYIIQGIEFDPKGRRVAYWIFPEHPGGYVTGKLMGVQAERVPASEILHLYRLDRIGQLHGIPFLAPALLRVRDFDVLEDAWLTREQVASCFAAFIYDIDGTIDAPAGKKDDEKLERLEPGTIETLPPGKKIEFANPPVAQGAADFAKSVLRGISVGTGVTYEALTNDYSNVNFSSARMGHLEFRKNVTELQWHVMVPQFCEPVFRWFSDAALISGVNIQGVTSRWAPPRPEMIDVDKETRANTAQIRSGQKTLSQVILENGDDPEEHFEELAADFKKLDEFGLVLDCDPRKMTAQGNAQPPLDAETGEAEDQSDSKPGKKPKKTSDQEDES